jgi:pimeloyl-ACP methyl ester carboxylesterase
MSVATDADPSLVVNGTQFEAIVRGEGRPILFLHPGIGIESDAPVLDLMARGGRLIAPSHPGFGNSPLPKGIASIDELSYFYLDLLETLDLRDVLVVGVGIGGWIACEIATKNANRLSHLILANAVGVKVGDRETSDIVDIWSISQAEFDALAWADPEKAKRDYASLPPERSLAAARNREASARFCWSPYMHNPRLRHRLHRVRLPTLFLWGKADRVLSEDYGRGFCAMIPGATFETIEQAGHFPHLEQPDAFARRALQFGRRSG